jgi:hypothetical protein
VTNPSIKILLLEPIYPIDNPHRGSGDLILPFKPSVVIVIIVGDGRGVLRALPALRTFLTRCLATPIE